MWLFLIPFVILGSCYILGFKIHHVQPPPGSLLSGIFKCLGIVYLLLLIQATPRVNDKHDIYKFYISLGLFFSLGGDWCLNWKDNYFITGVGFFALAQICYTIGFGFESPGLQTALMYTIAGIVCLLILLPSVRPTRLRPLIILYIMLLGVMGWRATTRYKDQQRMDTWCGMIGAVSFCISDFLIGYSRWKVKFSRSVLLIMVTYYLAQMLFTVSVIQPSWAVARGYHFLGI